MDFFIGKIRIIRILYIYVKDFRLSLNDSKSFFLSGGSKGWKPIKGEKNDFKMLCKKAREKRRAFLWISKIKTSNFFNARIYGSFLEKTC